jgi:hypothetical protein
VGPLEPNYRKDDRVMQSVPSPPATLRFAPPSVRMQWMQATGSACLVWGAPFITANVRDSFAKPSNFPGKADSDDMRPLGPQPQEGPGFGLPLPHNGVNE